MNVSNLNSWISLLGGGAVFATFLYKIWKALNAGIEANKKRTQDLNDRLDAQDMMIDELIYYVSLPQEQRKTPFNINTSLKNLRRKTIENFQGRNTSGFS